MYVLVLTEMWERFSFYGMRALLIFYLTQHFLYQDAQAFVIYGSYVSLVYVTPMLGGYVADHYLGHAKTVVFGGILMICGHLGMTFEGAAATVTVLADGTQSILRDEQALQAFYLSMALLVVGVGFLSPSIYTLLGRLYPAKGHRRDVGFIFFSIGINVGGGLAAFVCGYLGMTYGWAYGFGSAGIGMCIGLLVFLFGRRYLYGLDVPAGAKNTIRVHRTLRLRVEWVIYLAACLGVLVVWRVLQFGRLGGYLIVGQFVVAIGGIILYALFKLDLVERRNTFAVLSIMAASALFAVFIEQYGITLNLFTLRHVDLTAISSEFKAPQLQGLLAIFIICTAPAVIWLINFLANRQRNPSGFAKMAAGFVLMGVGYLTVTYGIAEAGQVGKVSAVFLVLMYFIWAVADNLFIPVSTSLLTKLSPKKMTGMLMGTLMLAFSVGYFGASIIAQWAAVDSESVGVDSLGRYGEFFAAMGGTAIVVGLGIYAVDRFAKKYTTAAD